jgi:RNA polymerase sigma-19 factor, ECF subfamily
MSEIPPYMEKELLMQLGNGQETSFDQIYRCYSARLYARLLKLVKNESLAREILQDAFVRLWEHRASIKGNTSLGPYLFRIAENRVCDFFRRAARDKRLEKQLMAAATERYDPVEKALWDKETHLILHKAIDALPAQRKRVFTLCKLEGKSYEEVSRDLGISTSTISDHIVKATRFLRDHLHDPKYKLALRISISILLIKA